MTWALTIATLLALTPAATQDKPEDKGKQTDEEKAKQKEAEKKAADQAKADIKKFSDAKKAMAADVVAALEDLGKAEPHPLILDEIIKFLAPKGPTWIDVPLAAGKIIGAKYHRSEKAADALFGTFGAFVRGKDLDSAEKFLGWFGDVRCRSKVSRLFNLFTDKELQIAAAAVDAAGTIKSKDAIQPLIDLATQIESQTEDDGKKKGGSNSGSAPGGGKMPGAGAGSAPAGGAPDPAEERKKRKDKLVPACLSALKSITNEKFNTTKEWRTWWSKYKASFKEVEDKD